MFPLFALFLGGVSVAALVVALRAQARADELGKKIEALRLALESVRERLQSSTKVKEEVAQPSTVADAPPVAFKPLPLTTASADIHSSKQIQFESAPPPSTGAAAPESTGAKKSPGIDWESFVGVKLFSWIAGIFLTIGAIYFLRYSIEQGWLSPEVRMAIG